jgi:hypothetical protein
MPNYCDCTVCIYYPGYGEDNNLLEIANFLATEEKKLSFYKVIPHVDWVAIDAIIEESDDYRIVYHFKTEWKPPTPVILQLSKLYPNNEISLEYYQMGMRFCGSMRVKNGVVLDEAKSKYYGVKGG